MNIKQKFGARLRSLRLLREMSQEDLAHRAKLHRTYVSSVERGERNVSLDTIQGFAKALKCKMAELMPDWSDQIQ